MAALLPPGSGPRLETRQEWPAAGPDRYDAIALLLPAGAQPGPRLPTPGSWKALARRGTSDHGSIRATTLGSEGHCLGVMGYCRIGASTFEQLRVAGLVAQKLFAERPQCRRIAIVVEAPQAERAGLQEALCSAVLAQAFALPSEKKTVTKPPAGVAAIDVIGHCPLDLKRLTVTAAATNLVRHLTALPPNRLDAAGYRRVIAQLARRHDLRQRWYDEKRLEKLGAGAFLAVSRGNPRRDAGIMHLSWRPRGRRGADRPDVALVGKGVLFDTGGVNLKTHRHMLDMHTDMSGSAVALAAITALAELKAPIAVDAWLAITENAIGPAAYRPQEIVRALDGTTIQVIHSDAEGRMILADTLALAARSRPRLMVDYATLTGACVYSLTERMSGVFANDDALREAFVKAGRDSGERLWPFPLPEDYDSDIESPVADVAQCAVDGKGDHILAARFLQRFLPKDQRWVHVDLSSATRRGGLAHVNTEITGFGARFTLAALLDQAVR
ncbi:MAG: M17 family metallopeptidase [Steroidobacteraceae bacterium]